MLSYPCPKTDAIKKGKKIERQREKKDPFSNLELPSELSRWLLFSFELIYAYFTWCLLCIRKHKQNNDDQIKQEGKRYLKVICLLLVYTQPTWLIKQPMVKIPGNFEQDFRPDCWYPELIGMSRRFLITNIFIYFLLCFLFVSFGTCLLCVLFNFCSLVLYPRLKLQLLKIWRLLMNGPDSC